MINRIINGIEIEINPLEADAIYLSEKDIANLKEFDIESIIYYILSKNDAKYIPLSMTIELTNKCNYNCPFCYIHDNDSKGSYGNFYRFEDIKMDLLWLIDHGLLYCTITGGEPLLHPDFKEIYLFMKNNGVLINLFTNLSLLNDEILDLILTYPPLKLETTMYAYNDPQYSLITNQTAFSAKDFKARVLMLKDKGINVICKTPLNSSTINEFEKCKKWCDENKVAYYYSENVSNSYNGIDMQAYKLNYDVILKIKKSRVVEIPKQDFFNFGKKQAFECGAGKCAFFISYDYCLRPCMSFYEIKDANFKIKYNEIHEAFNQMLDFINFYKNKPLTFCCGCTSKKICKVCVIDEIKYIQKGYDYRIKCNENSRILAEILDDKF